MYLPVLGRVDLLDWPIIAASFVLAWLEFVASAVAWVLPLSVLDACTAALRVVYRLARSPGVNILRSDNRYRLYISLPGPEPSDAEQYKRLMCLSSATCIASMCRVYGYGVEDRIVKTDDGYLITLHRITGDRPPLQTPRKVVYLHHGLLMNSEVWVTMLHKHQNLPYILYDLGYDVWLGNNRGNKYSQKHIRHSQLSLKFWDFSLDEFAFFDIPNSVDYILRVTNQPRLTYIGFSQGTAQSFAAVSANPDLERKIERIIAISPATTPHGLYLRFLDLLLKLSPLIMFLLFSRRMLLPLVCFWQHILYPPFFASMIDLSNYALFNWRSRNIDRAQKIASYAHLYSTTSVKTVVHWFQIMKARNFQMYHESGNMGTLAPTNFPLKNIAIPIHLIYGAADLLVDIDVMRAQLPLQHLTAVPVPGHEHLDNLWGRDVVQQVFSHVLLYLGEANLHEKLARVEARRCSDATRYEAVSPSHGVYNDENAPHTLLGAGPYKNGLVF